MKMKYVFGLILFMLMQPLRSELNLELPETILSSGVNGATSAAPINFSSIGIKKLRAVRKSAAVMEDPELNQWLRGIGNRLVAQTSFSNRPFYFVIVRDDDVNAFATQGGLIVINSGLILRAESESELAAVMAHEIAHITQQHIERIIAADKQNKLGNAAAVVAGLLVGSKDPTAGQAIFASAMAVDAHRSLRFGRSAETEADREGLRILASAKYNPNGMTRFLRKLGGGADARYSGISEYLTSHPLTAKRVSDVGQRAARYGAYQGKPSSAFPYMQQRIRVLTRHPGNSSKVAEAAVRYGKALRQLQQGKAAAATQLLNQHSKNGYQQLLRANAYNEQSQFDKALALLKSLHAARPNDEAVLIALADSLVGLKRYADAWKLLERFSLREQTSLDFLGTRQEVARLAGRTGQAYLSIAERNIRIGAYNHALIQLKQAQKVPNLSLAERQAVEQAMYRAKQFKKR